MRPKGPGSTLTIGTNQLAILEQSPLHFFILLPASGHDADFLAVLLDVCELLAKQIKDCLL